MGHRGFGLRRGRTISALVVVAVVAAVLLVPSPLDAQSLQGSRASLDRQNEQARLHDLTYLQTPADVRRFVDLGYLVPVRPNQDYDVHNVSFPYARPEVRLLIERLAAQYRAACGEKLVVTSLTRPISRQPPNASSRSVHPTGMALDLRVPQNPQCRSWLESTLLTLEGRGLLEAIREQRPPHYHVAVYPRPYADYVARMTGGSRTVADQASRDTEVRLEMVRHTVRRGDNLTQIARRYDTSVSRLQAENGLGSSRIMVGQVLQVPVYREVPVAGAQVAQAETGAAGPSESATSGTDDAAPALSQTATSEPTTHRVSRGESLWTLAQRYGTTVETLRRANGLDSNRIMAGQRLTIPGVESGSSGATALIEHTVRAGESLWAIARRHGISVSEIQRRNGMAGSRIHPGQVLAIPLGLGSN